MATVKLDLRRDVKFKDNHLPIVMVIIANRKKLVIHMGHTVQPDHWDAEKGLPNSKCPNSAHLKGLLLKKLSQAGKEVLRMEEETGRVDLQALKIILKPHEEAKGIQEYAQIIADNLLEAGKIGNSKAYLSTISKLNKFNGDKQLNFAEFNYKKLLEFEQFMAGKKIHTNTISFYMRTLRAIFNRAVKEGVCKEANYVFRDYTIRNEETRKRAITKPEIDAIRNLELEAGTPVEFARDMFMFSFYTRGMNLIDIAFLKKTDIQNGRIEYSRRKTAQLFSVKLIDAANNILKQYENDTPFLFPVIKRKGKEYLDYVSFKRLINKKLKDVALEAKITTTLTTYVARYSWATIAKRQGITTAIISEGLGHESEQTTQVYLDSFENEVLDRANELVTG
ncbi:MAG: site-specific integrase [Bacteroidales bacterium]|jgi:site-specific recombinase XerD